jgi:hypothetical protein
MNEREYRDHCLGLLQEFAKDLEQRTRDLGDTDSLRELATAFADLSARLDNVYEEGPELVSRLFTTYPDFAPGFPREVLWFLGGTCLHYMPDDEIERFQREAEQRAPDSGSAEVIDLQTARRDAESG